MSVDGIDIVVRLQGERVVAAKARRVSRDINDIGKSADNTRHRFRGLNHELGITPALLTKLAVVGGVISLFGMLIQVVSVLVTGLVALTAAIAPLAGMFVALPAGILAVAQGMKVLKLATHGVMDAVGGLNEFLDEDKLAELTPAARALAVQLDQLKVPVLDLQRIAQDGLLPGVRVGLREIEGVLTSLEPVVRLTAETLGSLAASAGAMVSGWGPDLVTIGISNAVVLGLMGAAALSLLDALRTILVVAGPFVEWMATGVAAWAANVAGMAAAGRASERLAGFFTLVQHTMQLVWSVLKPFGQGLVDILSAALAPGQQMLGMLRGSAEAFAAMTGSPAGKASIQKWFADALPAMREAGKLVSALIHGFFAFGSGKDVAPLIKSLRTDLLPALAHLMDVTTRDFGPVLIPALVSIIQLFAALVTSGGPLITVVAMVGHFAAGLAGLITTHPGLGHLIGLFAAGALAVAGVTKAVAILKAAVWLFTTEAIRAWVLMEAKALAVVWGLRAWAAATWLATAATTAFGVAWAILTAPITLVVLAIAAVATGLYLAYTKVEWFRNGVNNACSAIVGFFQNMTAKLQGLWDSMKFDIKVGGHGLGFSMGDVAKGAAHLAFPTMPALAGGGTVTGPGSWITGERGPEVNSFDGRRVRVQPLTGAGAVKGGGLRDMLEPFLRAAQTGGNRTTQLVVDGKVLAEVVDEHTGDASARA